jgi:hypothetical protein
MKNAAVGDEMQKERIKAGKNQRQKFLFERSLLFMT